MATNNSTLSPATQLLQQLGPASLGSPETEEERKKRLAAIQNATQATQGKLGTTPGSTLSPATNLLLGLGGGYGGI